MEHERREAFNGLMKDLTKAAKMRIAVGAIATAAVFVPVAAISYGMDWYLDRDPPPLCREDLNQGDCAVSEEDLQDPLDPLEMASVLSLGIGAFTAAAAGGPIRRPED